MNNKKDAIRSVYKERERLIIIGLTGRTGSGCSTVAKILSQESFDNLDLKSYKTCGYDNADERKYSYVYRFMKEGNRWEKFLIIDASSVIFSFVLSDTYENLEKFLTALSKRIQAPSSNGIITKVIKELNEICLTEHGIIDNKL